MGSVEDGAWLYRHALTLGLEGEVGKRAGSVYQSGERSRDWVKIKRPGADDLSRFRTIPATAWFGACAILVH